jgi:ABC-type multidrug transport system ATPase subunit
MRKGQDGLSGSIYLDGAVPSRATVKLRTSYVQQDDALCAWSTIEESLLFAAACKLRGCDAAEQRTRVESVLASMRLAGARSSLIGSRLVRGCSGGEKKRTSVAAGLLGKPRCMFLDEPTSGLDSATAWGGA